ncbi:MAG: Nif3-like dinuclear metal center hexameric protein [Bacteroidetes bacterium GWE2_29_8]|nr:MAG: Nif3-like dinuclear metal center hexameric protein [Bacteroidetes bacterium GWE2_29_8]OFY18355.1 MAG: Nif3-like dinuclear metal center hexameric protein [Bacteroidetes bacterium GWF2_29_10]
MLKLRSVINEMEHVFPLQLQEEYDNSGLQVGDYNIKLEGILITLDCTLETIKEAKEKGCNLIISHHPLIFKSLKQLSPQNEIGKIIFEAIKNNIAIYSVHTNADNSINGVNNKIAEKIGLKDISILSSTRSMLRKLVTYCPLSDSEQVRQSLFEAGGGCIGNYDSCSFNVEGIGTFKGNDLSTPFVGEKNILHKEKEERIELIYPFYKEIELINALKKTHPYEEVAYDIYKLENNFDNVGSGLIGKLENHTDAKSFLNKIKEIFNVPHIKYSGEITKKNIQKVALCGGSGSFLIKEAKRQGAEIFLTGDIKYHDFFEFTNQFIIADIGHYESEQFTKELIYEILIKKFPTFAIYLSEVNTNPIKVF